MKISTSSPQYGHVTKNWPLTAAADER
jgi:hypothetical protein